MHDTSCLHLRLPPNRFWNPLIVPDPALPAIHLSEPAPGGPGPTQALVCVLAYFGLQLALSLPLYPLLGWLRRHPAVTAHGWGPDLLLWATCLDLGIAGLIMLGVTRKLWPQAWAREGSDGLGFAAAAPRQWLAGALVGLIVIPLLGSWLTEWLAHGQTITEQIDALITDAGRWARIPIVLLTVTLVPVVEETLFRGVLLSALRQRFPRAMAVCLTSAAFALAHLGSFDYQWYALPALALFAWALAELRIRSGSIWPGVAAHACNNAVAIIAILGSPHAG